MNKGSGSTYTVSITILISGVLIALSIYFYHNPLAFGGIENADGGIATFTPPSISDHILGNPGAPIKILEYCDIQAPYCIQFQNVMNGIMQTYGPSGKVAWIYRHFPLIDTDPNETANGNAVECAASLGGSDAFFSFVNALSTTTVETSEYASIAEKLKLPAAEFSSCIINATYSQKITDAYQEGVTAGATGVPYTILVVAGHEPNTIVGATSYAQMKDVIDQAIAVLNQK